MNIEELGYNSTLEEFRKANGLDTFEVGRIIAEHKERYVVKSGDEDFDAELIGNLRYTAESRYDFPAVGDWVAYTKYDEGKALVHTVYPRKSVIVRKAVGKIGQVQIIASNVDFGLIVQSVDRDFNLNRLERYLTICNSANIEPIIVLSKIDLIDALELSSLKKEIIHRIHDIEVITTSSESVGYEGLRAKIEPSKTYALLGSSGVGKSTIINHLSGKSIMKTGEISSSHQKGRHVTSHRELIVLEQGGILIDNPGMREIGITDVKGGLEKTFESLLEYVKLCKFNDCTHTQEFGCAILDALRKGDIAEAIYNNFMKMEREKHHFESDLQERKRKDKALGKLIKEVKAHRKHRKY